MTLRPPRRGFSVSRQLSERARAAQAEAARSAPPPADGGPAMSGVGGFAGMAEGVAGMVGALRGLVEQLTAAAAEQAQQKPSGEAGHAKAGSDPEAMQRTIDLGSGNTRMVFGYTLRMGSDGLSAERFGNTPAPASGKGADTAAGATPAALLPIVEVFEDGDAIVVVAELPGADPERIVCRVDGLLLLIEAAGVRQYRKELALPVRVRADGVVQSFRNGILEVRLARADLP